MSFLASSLPNPVSQLPLDLLHLPMSAKTQEAQSTALHQTMPAMSTSTMFPLFPLGLTLHTLPASLPVLPW